MLKPDCFTLTCGKAQPELFRAVGFIQPSVIYKTFDPPLAEGNTTGDDGFILVENWAY